MDSKPTKNIGHFEENKFSVGHRQFLLNHCPMLIKTNNFGQNADNKRQLKGLDMLIFNKDQNNDSIRRHLTFDG